MFYSGRHRGVIGELPEVDCFSFCRWNVSDEFEQSVARISAQVRCGDCTAASRRRRHWSPTGLNGEQTKIWVVRGEGGNQPYATLAAFNVPRLLSMH